MINKFEELIAWQKSRELVTAIYKVTNGKEFSRDFGLRDQIRRAAVSIMSNGGQISNLSPYSLNEQAEPNFTSFWLLPKVRAPKSDHSYTSH